MSQISDDQVKMQRLKELEELKPQLISQLEDHFRQFMCDVAATCTPYIHNLLQNEIKACVVYIVRDVHWQDDHTDGEEMNAPPAAVPVLDSELDGYISGNPTGTDSYDQLNSTPTIMTRIQSELFSVAQSMMHAVVNNVTRTSNLVLVDTQTDMHVCTCMYSVQYGLPCRHMIAVFYQKRWLLTIAAIHPRWFKSDRRRTVGTAQPAPYRDPQAIVRQSLEHMNNQLHSPVHKQDPKERSASADNWLHKHAMNHAHALVDRFELLYKITVQELGELPLLDALERVQQETFRQVTHQMHQRAKFSGRQGVPGLAEAWAAAIATENRRPEEESNHSSRLLNPPTLSGRSRAAPAVSLYPVFTAHDFDDIQQYPRTTVVTSHDCVLSVDDDPPDDEKPARKLMKLGPRGNRARTKNVSGQKRPRTLTSTASDSRHAEALETTDAEPPNRTSRDGTQRRKV